MSCLEKRIMSVKQEILNDGMNINISITGRFDYKVSQDFRNSYRKIPSYQEITYYIDLSDANYMDSSALGMLLLLREHAKSYNGTVVIDRPSIEINNILKVANFEQLFTINYTRPVNQVAENNSRV